jgi:hypothetical protein
MPRDVAGLVARVSRENPAQGPARTLSVGEDSRLIHQPAGWQRREQ